MFVFVVAFVVCFDFVVVAIVVVGFGESLCFLFIWVPRGCRHAGSRFTNEEQKKVAFTDDKQCRLRRCYACRPFLRSSNVDVYKQPYHEC